MGKYKIAWVLDGLPICGGVRIPFGYCRELRKLGIDSTVYANARNKELEDYYGVSVRPIQDLVHFTDNDVIIAVWWKQIPLLEKYKGKKFQFVQGKDIDGVGESYKKECLSIRQRDWQVIAVSDFAGNWVGKEYSVIPNAVDDIFFLDYNVERDIDILIEGVDEPNKNIHYSINKAREEGCEKIVWFATRTHPIEGVICVTNPPFLTIPLLYRRAKKFYKHSISEGFCLPLAEALVSGCECIYNNMGGNDFTGLDFKWSTSVAKLLQLLDGK